MSVGIGEVEMARGCLPVHCTAVPVSYFIKNPSVSSVKEHTFN
jgi:hypothetical protein